MDKETPDIAPYPGPPPLQNETHILSEGYGIAPFKVMFDVRLTSGAKNLYYYLNGLSAATGTCFPKNKHLAEKFEVSTRTITSQLRELMDFEYVLTSFADQDTQTGKRTLLLYERGGWKKTSRGVEENFQGGRKSATEITETITNTYKYKHNKEALEQLDKLYRLYLIRMKLDYDKLERLPVEEKRSLLDVAKKNYRLTPKRKEKVLRRLEDCGYEMCYRAIRNLSKSDFHRGENDRKWTAHLDWIMGSVEKVEEWANKEDQ